MRRLIPLFLWAAPLLAPAADVDARRLRAAYTAEPGQWLSYGRDYSEQRYSPLKQINVDTVGRLGLAWYGDLYERGGSYEGTPVVADGRIYVTSPWSKVYAFDAKTGKQLWKYDPQVPGAFAVSACCGIDGRVGNLFPDLKYAGSLHSPELFKAIVIDGVLQANGMVSFSKLLTPADAEAIRAHVVRLANEAKNAPATVPAGRGAGGPPPAPAPAAAPAAEPALHQ